MKLPGFLYAIPISLTISIAPAAPGTTGSAEKTRAELLVVKRKQKLVAEEQQRVFQAIQTAQQRLEDFKNGLAALDRRETDLRELAQNLTAAVSQLRTKKAEVANLETELQNTHSPFESQVASLPKAVAATKKPVLIELFRERAIPVTKTNFHFDVPKWSGPTLAIRTGIGETAAEIAKPASSFNKFLSGIKPDKQYVACLLNSDSFYIYREVRKLAKAKGIAVGWEPIDSSAGKITLYPVHLAKDPKTEGSKLSVKPDKDKKMPRVTAIIE